jgi:hypothetical protein
VCCSGDSRHLRSPSGGHAGERERERERQGRWQGCGRRTKEVVRGGRGGRARGIDVLTLPPGGSYSGQGCTLTPSPRHLGRRPRGEARAAVARARADRPPRQTLTLADLGQGSAPLFFFLFFPNGLLSLNQPI